MQDNQKNNQIDRLLEAYKTRFGSLAGVLTARAPGRVNLIGEHTDYNEGFVLPMTIDYNFCIAGRMCPDDTVKVYSVDFQDFVEFPIADPVFDREHHWVNYFKGVLRQFVARGYTPGGMEIALTSNIPQGAGLSSSAAYEVAAAVLVDAMHQFCLDRVELIKLCRQAENEFIGVQCGIMDQFVSCLGRQGFALFLDCRDLHYEFAPLQMEEYIFVVCDSMVKHELASSEYNLRRLQCGQAVEKLRKIFPEAGSLRDIYPEMLLANKEILTETEYKRAYHVVTENERVQKAVSALKEGRLLDFGRYMNESHESLRDYYEVSCKELDCLVELALSVPGVPGARMTGGGFGGCTVNLVPVDRLPLFMQTVAEGYYTRFGKKPEVVPCRTSPGAMVEEAGQGRK